MYIKWILGTIAVLAMVIILYLYLRKSTDFEPLIKDKLTQLVSKASDGLYILTMDSIEVDVIASTITAANVSITPDSARMLVLDQLSLLPNDIYNGTLKRLVITGAAAKDLINAKNISLNEVLMNEPEITITHKKRNYNRADTGNFYSRIAPGNESYSIKNLTLNNIQLTHKNLSKNNQVSTLKNLNAVFKDIKIDSSSVQDSARFLFASDAVMFLKDYSVNTPDNLYKFSMDSIALKPQQGSLLAKKIRLKPLGTKDDFSAKIDFLQDRFDVLFEEAIFTNIDWWSLIGNDALLADSIYLKGGHVHVYNDKRLPNRGKSKVGNYPHQLLMKADLPVNMKYLSIVNVNVSFEEYNPESGKAGKLVFNDVKSEMWNITNMPAQIAITRHMKMKARSKFMNEANMDVGFQFDLMNAGRGDFSVQATMGAMDGKNLNMATEGLGLMKIETMQMDQLKVNLNGSNTKANGTVLLAYHDLKVAALKEDKDAGGALKKRPLISFLANTFVIKKANPVAGEEPKQYPVAVERDSYRSFFSLIWEGIKDGATKTLKGK